MVSKYKSEAFRELVATNALKIQGEHKLKSGRLSPYFLNIGDLNTGKTTAFVGKAFAGAINAAIGHDFDLVYGIPEKGVSLAPATAMEYYKEFGEEKAWFFTRKFAKTHGEATNLASQIVGRMPKDGDRIVLIDDVLTTGLAKYEAIEQLKALAPKAKIVGLVIMMDRQEVAISGKNAVEEFQEKTGIPVFPVLQATDVFDLAEGDAAAKMRLYLRVYGTGAASSYMGRYVPKFNGYLKNGIIPACDMDSIEAFEEMVKQTSKVKGLSGYKLGFELGLKYGLPKLVETIRKHTDIEIIYDHQKAGSDIPDTGKAFAKTAKEAGVNTVIFFPQAGPETERAWIYRAYEQELGVIVGGIMTHPAYLVSEGGFIQDEAALNIYRIAANAGVHRFVVPGTKPEIIMKIRDALAAEGMRIDGGPEPRPIFYSPGLVAQGGSIAAINQILGDNWHGIIGRDIVNAKDGKYGEAAEVRAKELLRLN
jgi:orotidine-5'-phosphate decarboxylase